MRIYLGSSIPSVELLIIDAEGAPVTDVVAADIATSWQRHAAGLPIGNGTSFTTVDLDSPADPWEAGGFIHRTGGIYRLDLPTGATASGNDNANRLVVTALHDTYTIVTRDVDLEPIPLSSQDVLQLRYRLGIDGATAEPQDNNPNLGNLNVVVSYSVIANAQGVTAGTISQQRATDWMITFANAPDLRGNEKLLFTVKGAIGEPDANAFLQLQLSDPPNAADGLVRLLGQAPSSGDVAKATLSLDADGKPVIHVHPTIAAQLAPRNYVWGVKAINSTGTPYPEVREPARGSFNVTDVVTQAVQ